MQAKQKTLSGISKGKPLKKLILWSLIYWLRITGSVLFTLLRPPARKTYIGLDKYLHQEGLAYRLLPVPVKVTEQEIGDVNTTVMYDNVMNKFRNGGMNNPKVYLDENNTRHGDEHPFSVCTPCTALLAEGRKDSARKVIERCLTEIPIIQFLTITSW